MYDYGSLAWERQAKGKLQLLRWHHDVLSWTPAVRRAACAHQEQQSWGERRKCARLRRPKLSSGHSSPGPVGYGSGSGGGGVVVDAVVTAAPHWKWLWWGAVTASYHKLWAKKTCTITDNYQLLAFAKQIFLQCTRHNHAVHSTAAWWRRMEWNDALCHLVLSFHQSWFLSVIDS